MIDKRSQEQALYRLTNAISDAVNAVIALEPVSRTQSMMMYSRYSQYGLKAIDERFTKAEARQKRFDDGPPDDQAAAA